MCGFGAERVADRPDTRPEVDDGTGTEVTVGGSMTDFEDGMLKITVERWEWKLRANDTLSGIKTGHYAQVEDTDDDDDLEEDKRPYEISLVSLCSNQGRERNFNGDKWVDLARDDISKIRAKLAALLDADQLPASQYDLWKDFQYVVATTLFDVSDLDNSDIAESYDRSEGDEALDIMDDALEALSDLGALDEDRGASSRTTTATPSTTGRRATSGMRGSRR